MDVTRSTTSPGGGVIAGSQSSSSEILEEFAGGATSMDDNVRFAGNIVRSALWYCAELISLYKFTTELLDKVCVLADEASQYCELIHLLAVWARNFDTSEPKPLVFDKTAHFLLRKPLPFDVAPTSAMVHESRIFQVLSQMQDLKCIF